jgi:hypothetical protein
MRQIGDCCEPFPASGPVRPGIAPVPGMCGALTRAVGTTIPHTHKERMKTPGIKLATALALPLLAGLLATQCIAADHFIGVNFTGGGGNGGARSLDPLDSAGVVPQTNWNNFSALVETNGYLRDSEGNLLGVKLSYQTSQMLGSGAYSDEYGYTNANDKLFQGYLSSSASDTPTGTNTITFENLSPGDTYTLLAYALRDADGEQAAYWVNEDSANAFVILTLGGASWQFQPQFLRGVNKVRPSSEYANYVRWDGLSPRPDGTLSISVASENLSGPINGIQLISSNAYPPNTQMPQFTLPPRNVKVSLGQAGTFRATGDGPWAFQWYSNNIAIAGATGSTFTTVPISSIEETRINYRVTVNNGPFSQTSPDVHLILVPDLPPGGIFYDGFDYPAGDLGNWGSWNETNPNAKLTGPGTAQVTESGLTYTDEGGRSLAVSGGALVPPREPAGWNSPDFLPIKAFETAQGGAHTVIFMSYLFDFRNRDGGSGGIGFSGFNLVSGSALDWGNERFWVGTRGEVLGFDSGLPNQPNSVVPTATNGFVVVRLTQDDATTTADLFFNPPLDALPLTPTYTPDAPQQNLIVFNGVGVNAGDWNRVDPDAEGPVIDEFRFGTTYASVAPIAAAPSPTLTIQWVGTNLQISWDPAVGYTLQQSDSLSSPNWVAGPTGNPVLISPTQAVRFYRLLK